jgi:hypothetical protein
MLPRISLRRLCDFLVGALVVAGALTGCTNSSDGGSTSPGVKATQSVASEEPPLDPAIVSVADPRAVRRPLAERRLAPARIEIINRARELAGDACMRQFGFTPAPNWTHTTFDPHAFALWSRYGLWDPIATETGYLPPDHFDRKGQDLPPYTGEAKQVYAGKIREYAGRPVPEGGCAEEASRVVMPPADVTEGIPNLVDDLDREAQERTRQDSRVLPLLDAWRDCMRDSGWEYEYVSSPFMYWNEPPRRGIDQNVESGDISSDEKRSARDDLACKKSTGLLGTWLAADIAYQHEIVKREGRRLVEYSRYWDKVLTNANRIISEGGR